MSNDGNANQVVGAIDILQCVRDLADRYRDSADSYLAAMNECPRAKVQAGQFYVTFDGSIVFVARRRTRCNCPICTGEYMSELAALFGYPPQQSPPDPHEEDAQPPAFIVSVLRGGHGIETLNGARPGETYIVDESGLVTIQSPAGNGVISKSHLGLAALSLRERLRIELHREQQ